MNKVSNPEQPSHAMRFSTTTIGDGSLATDVSKSAHTTMPDVFENSHAELFDDRTTLLGHDAQATLKNRAVPSSESRDGTEPSPASSNVIVVRYASIEPDNANSVISSDYGRIAAGGTLIVCVEGSPSWDEIVTLIRSTVDCTGITLLPIDTAATQLNPATDTAEGSAPIVTNSASPEPVSQPGATKPNNLTPREYEVIQLYQSGMSTKKVAGVLGISIETVCTHRRNIFFKLGCRSIVQAIAKMAAANPAASTLL